MYRVPLLCFVVAAQLVAAGAAFAQTSSVPYGAVCASEGGRCSFSGGGNVFYGANDHWVVRPFTNGVDCNSTQFGGDPAPGVAKACRVLLTQPQGTLCAPEGGQCAFSGAATVYYGAKDRWLPALLQNGATCTNVAFQQDPYPNVVKQCYVASTLTFTPNQLLVDTISGSIHSYGTAHALRVGNTAAQPFTMQKTGKLRRVFILAGNPNWSPTVTVRIRQGTTVLGETTVTYSAPAPSLADFKGAADFWAGGYMQGFAMTLVNDTPLLQGASYTLEITSVNASSLSTSYSLPLISGQPALCSTNGLGQLVFPGPDPMYTTGRCLHIGLVGDLAN